MGFGYGGGFEDILGAFFGTREGRGEAEARRRPDASPAARPGGGRERRDQGDRDPKDGALRHLQGERGVPGDHAQEVRPVRRDRPGPEDAERRLRQVHPRRDLRQVQGDREHRRLAMQGVQGDRPREEAAEDPHPGPRGGRRRAHPEAEGRGRGGGGRHAPWRPLRGREHPRAPGLQEAGQRPLRRGPA